MPNNDKTGPNGEGPQTGRGMGQCEDDQRYCPFNKRRTRRMRNRNGRRSWRERLNDDLQRNGRTD